ncbi:site-specific integrase [Nocardia brasiliensis]|uniref:site-specific integrase n=1 Tax=Nocardia brasiliensis TaxID=37326 RepID=UPI003D9403EE
MTFALARPSAEGAATETIWNAVTAEFLETVCWSAETKILVFPQDHPVLGWSPCAVAGCHNRVLRRGLCLNCEKRWRRAGKPPVEQFVPTVEVVHGRIPPQSCAVTDCALPRRTVGTNLCLKHHYQRTRVFKVGLEEFLAHPDVAGFAMVGICEVASCARHRERETSPYCRNHQEQWRRFTRAATPDELSERHWRRTQPAIAAGGEISLGGLPERLVAELLYALQQRTANGVKTDASYFRRVADCLRTQGASGLEQARSSGPKAVNKLIRLYALLVRQLHLDPETERLKDEWDTTVYGHTGTLRFGGISQDWLKEAAKAWALDYLPRHRGTSARGRCQTGIGFIVLLSDSLRSQREDHGEDPAALSRTDITAFLNRLAFLESAETISARHRMVCIRQLRKTLADMRAVGLTRPGQPLHGLHDDFTLRDTDSPTDPEEEPPGRDLPVEVIRHLCMHLDNLEAQTSREIRVAVELVIDTGRRPDEICQLAVDCLERDELGGPVLSYDNFKAARHGRRLPISQATASVIEQQQQRVRSRFPDRPAHTLKLLPSAQKNPHGRRGLLDTTVSSSHRRWVDSLPEVMVPITVHADGTSITKMIPFDKRRIFLYAYRHTYAQRHADAGVAVDVLCQLMDHLHMFTTQRYYRVGEKRRREAVERVTAMQFDRHGNRIWREAKALLDSEHMRLAVGAVAVPYGTCNEPGNVAAGGDDCPVRFRCVGCAHFSTDISYLPDLEAYLSDLLRSRERLRSAFTAADDWAKTESMPSDEEITRIRRLISAIKADVDILSEQDRAQIESAVDVVRRGRNKIVGLGLPQIRQPLPDVRPDRSA